jgi:hypothetical protein
VLFCPSLVRPEANDGLVRQDVGATRGDEAEDDMAQDEGQQVWPELLPEH